MTRSIYGAVTLALTLLTIAASSPPTLAGEGELALLEVADGDDIDLGADEYINVIDDLGPGTCNPDRVAAEQLMTCSFELVGNAVEIEPYLSLHAGIIGNERAASSRCAVEGRTLVCPDLLAPFEDGPFEVTVAPIGGDRSLASASVTRTVDGVLGLVLTYRRVPNVFAGVETSIGTFRSFALAADDEAELLLRRDGEDEIVARVPALPADADEGVAVLTIPEPGRWTVTGCVAAADGSCRIEGIRRPLHAIDPTPIPLLPDHNGPPEDRINLVFAGSGFGEGDDLPGTVTQLLSLDGEPIPIDIQGDVYALDWGPFSIEPLREELDRFNLWYLADDVPSGSIVVNPTFADPHPQIRVEDLGLGTAVSIVTLSRNGFVDGARANAELTSFADDATLPDRADVRFGSAYLPVVAEDPTAAATLAHELGHALFGLRDEYEEFTEFGGVEPLLGRPNCVGTAAEAEEHWGPLVGELDPMFTRWQEAMVEFDLWFEDADAADDFTVDLVTGGCFGPADGDGAFRPTVRSLMNGQEPVLGTVNRQRVQAVLDLFPEPPPPSPSTTAAPSPTPTTDAAPTTSESELASDPVDDNAPAGWLPVAAGFGAAVAAVGVAAIAVGRRRRRTV